MSSPEKGRGAAPEERKLTLIVVPHGHLETRSYLISYRRLKALVVCVIIGFLALGVVLATYVPIMAQAARVPALVRELKELEEERARVAELARTLQQVEEQYERVRQMLGADAPGHGETAPLLPPLRSDSGQTERPGDSATLSSSAPQDSGRARQTGPS
jgi:cell division protein FtsB